MTETLTDLSAASWVGDPAAPLRGSAVSCQHTENERGQITPSLAVSLSSGVLEGRLEELVPVELDETSNSALDRGGMVAFYDPEDPGLNQTWLCGSGIGDFSIRIDTAVVVAENATSAAYAANGEAMGRCVGSFGSPGVVMLTASWYPAP